MSTIVIKPKTKEEQNFITRLLKKMNIDVNVVVKEHKGKQK
jgi:hypothetical protein